MWFGWVGGLVLSVGGLGVVGVVVLVYSGCCWFHEFFSVGSILVGGLSVDDSKIMIFTDDQRFVYFGRPA